MSNLSTHTDKKQVTIEVDRIRCKKCGLCIEFCAMDVFESDGGMPLVVRQDKCNACEICELICPDFAINLRTTQA